MATLTPTQEEVIISFWREVNDAWVYAKSDEEPDHVQIHRWILQLTQIIMDVQGIKPHS